MQHPRNDDHRDGDAGQRNRTPSPRLHPSRRCSLASSLVVFLSGQETLETVILWVRAAFFSSA